MVTDQPAAHVEPDPLVRRVRKDEMDVIMPACVAMFTEEVGVSPMAGDGGLLYQARVAELVGAGRSFARIEDGKVVFKAEIGAATPQACQVQGVWVAPEYRGRGLSETGMAAVLRYALADVAPVVSLYVNDYNAPARAAYRRVGFREVGAFMSDAVLGFAPWMTTWRPPSRSRSARSTCPHGWTRPSPCRPWPSA